EGGDAGSAPAQLLRRGLAYAACRSGDQDAGAHAATSAGAHGTAAGSVAYSLRSQLRSSLEKRNVWSGHSVALRPLLSMYQLAQPPSVQTVPSIRSCTDAFHASWAAGSGSTVTARARSMWSRARRM